MRWLVEKEFITQKAGRYSTNFLVSTQEEAFGYYEIYYKYRHELSERLIDGLGNAQEKLRAIGFHGSDAPMEKLLCYILHSDFDASWIHEEQKRQLAQLVEMGFVRLEGKKAVPNFVVFTKEQYEQLTNEVFDDDVSGEVMQGFGKMM